MTNSMNDQFPEQSSDKYFRQGNLSQSLPQASAGAEVEATGTGTTVIKTKISVFKKIDHSIESVEHSRCSKGLECKIQAQLLLNRS